MIKLGGIISGTGFGPYTSTKGSDAVKGGVSPADDSKPKVVEGKALDIYNSIKKGTGWATADYITNNAHINLNETERLIVLLKLAKERRLADETKLNGKEQSLKDINPSALMSVKDVTKKYGNIKSRYDESISSLAEKIGKLTGIRSTSIQKFIELNKLSAEALYKYVKNGKIKEKMDVITAIVGNPGNPYQSKLVRQFSESINEDASKVWKYKGVFMVDSDFVNSSKGKLPNSELKHAGMGDFFLQTPAGIVSFDRTNGKLDGMSGRAHQMGGDQKLIAQLIKKMGAKIINA